MRTSALSIALGSNNSHIQHLSFLFSELVLCGAKILHIVHICHDHPYGFLNYHHFHILFIVFQKFRKNILGPALCLSVMDLPWPQLIFSSIAGSFCLIQLAPQYSPLSSYLGLFIVLFLAFTAPALSFKVFLWPKLFSPLRHLPSPPVRCRLRC